MAIKKSSNRQYTLTASQAITFDEVVGLSGVAQPAVQLPAGSSVLSCSVVIDTAFNSTTDAMAVTGGGTTVTVSNAKSTGRTAGTVSGVVNAQDTDVTLAWTGTGGAPTSGAGRLIVSYVVNERSNENQG
jgi:hypothetical protein